MAASRFASQSERTAKALATCPGNTKVIPSRRASGTGIFWPLIFADVTALPPAYVEVNSIGWPCALIFTKELTGTKSGPTTTSKRLIL